MLQRRPRLVIDEHVPPGMAQADGSAACDLKGTVVAVVLETPSLYGASRTAIAEKVAVSLGEPGSNPKAHPEPCIHHDSAHTGRKRLQQNHTRYALLPHKKKFFFPRHKIEGTVNDLSLH